MTSPVSRPSSADDTAARRHWMSVLARAGTPEIEAGLRRRGPIPAWTLLRGPETGLAMVRGRAGGTGQKFNLGEMTVTRCSVRLASGTTGHAYVAGRDERRAELAAAADALLQDEPALRGALIPTLEAAQRAIREARAEKAAATKVEFFAMRNMRS